MHMITLLKYDFKSYMLISSGIVVIYYVLKVIIIYTKDKKEYFALAAGDHVEGMEPFADVQKRMERAIELLAATGHQAVAAVSHGAAIMCFWQGLRIMRSEPERQDSTMGQSM